MKKNPWVEALCDAVNKKIGAAATLEGVLEFAAQNGAIALSFDPEFNLLEMSFAGRVAYVATTVSVRT